MNHRRNERGVALIICLFALMLLSGIGLGMMYMADTETSINRNYRDSQQAYFAAAAGLQEARERLTPTSTTVLTAAQRPTTLPGNNVATGVVYILNPSNSVPVGNIQPWTSGNAYFDTEFCHENFASGGSALVTNTGPNTPCAAVPTGTYYTTVNSNSPFLGSDANLAYRWVRVTQKTNATAAPDTTLTTSFYVNTSGSANNVQICWNGTNEIPKPAGYVTCDDDPPPDTITYLKSVYVLTSLAVTTAGSRRMTQMEVANNPPFLTNAAVDTNNFVTVSGSSVTVNGYDNCKCSCTTAVGSAAPTCKDRATGAACTGNTFSIFSSQSVTTSGGPALVAGTDPAVAQNQKFPYDINSLIATYSNMAGVVNLSSLPTSSPDHVYCSPNTPPAYPQCGPNPGGTGNMTNTTFGTAPSPFPPTDPTNPVGAVNQITYIPGSASINAQSSGAGVLIVDGDLNLNAGLNFYGLIIVRGVLTYSGSGNGQNLNVAGSVIAGAGSAVDTLKGGINIQYDRCALLHNMTPQPPTMLTTHEATY